MREIIKQQQAAWDFLQKERDERIRQTDTVEAMQELTLAARHALSLPYRTTSGLAEYYAQMRRVTHERPC